MSDFKDRVEQVVSSIPIGKVMTYGQIASVCGSPRSARVVGGIAHYGLDSLPWQRVVNYRGGLASGYPGGRSSHKTHLEKEGIKVSEDYYVKLADYLYVPE